MSAPNVLGPAQLPDLRLWMADQWAPGRPFARAAAPMHAARCITGSADAYARHEAVTLRQATLWWVAADMVDLLLASARNVPDDAHLADLPKMPGAGLVVFEKPWWGIDGERAGEQVQVDALTWGGCQLPPIPDRGRSRATVAVSVSTYRRINFDLGLTGPELSLAAGTGATMHATYHPVSDDDPERGEAALAMAEAIHEPERRKHDGSALLGAWEEHPDWGAMASDGARTMRLTGESWVPLGRSDWPVGDRLGRPPWSDVTETAAASMIEDRKVLAAMWALLHQQGIASRIVREPERAARRRTERAGLPRELAKVQVVTLRKLERTASAPSDDEHAKREWSHRWLVAGHWRWQPYGPQRSLRRLTFVRPHVKGPEDKPLHVPDRVNAWVR